MAGKITIISKDKDRAERMREALEEHQKNWRSPRHNTMTQQVPSYKDKKGRKGGRRKKR